MKALRGNERALAKANFMILLVPRRLEKNLVAALRSLALMLDR